ncbi:hypothetical protein V9T40_003145 [Parthenolecanium corni]|uniref:WD repeat-containing protein 48 homolog n=1 Tax=Parthenolecanium corni TaxID=536013 RepID=A0AAN9TS03_9HEMI
MLPAHKKIQQPNAASKKVMVSFVVRDEHEPKHRAGINSLQYDAAMDRLFSAGRDSIIRTWNCKKLNDPYIQSLEHHTDWVNDIVLCCGGKNLISASSDTTVKVWNAHKGFCMSTLRTHKDYVRALAYARDQERVASAGLDKAIFLWDINTLTALTASNNTVTTSSLVGSKNSIYSLAMNPSGTIVVGGSTEKVLRVWDPRSCQKLMKLIGHSDNVKSLLVNRDGTSCLSGSSDGTIKMWSLGQQQCILTIREHKEGVWALAANENFDFVISSGRDHRIYITNLKTINTKLVTEVQNPVLKICPNPNFSGIWVATDESTINYYDLNEDSDTMELTDGDCNNETIVPPKMTIEGAPAIKKYHILNDKRHILTQDSQGNVCLYDVLQIKKLEDYGQIDFDEMVKEKFKLTYVPNWFNVDLKTGFLTIHLGQEETDCLCAWVNGKEIGLTTPPDQKVNYGSVLLGALLKHWRYTVMEDEKEEISKEGNSSNPPSLSNGVIQVPQHTPVIFTEVGNRTLYRVAVHDCGGPTETHILNETVPEWVREVLILKKTSKFIKISFYLLPLTEVSTKTPKRERLVANDFVQVQKIIEHVSEKLTGAECANTACPSTASNSEKTNTSLPETQTLLLDLIDILCNDQVLDPNMELRTVRYHIWKSSSDLTLHYRVNKNV